MSLIEELGGYQAAKSIQAQRALDGLLHDYDWKLHSELLEYRRANRIFENGDLIVYPWMDDKIHKYNAQYIIKSPWRHATDAEIAAGRRL